MLHIRNTIMSATKLTKDIMKRQQEIESRDWVLYRIFTEMTNCQTGFTNLKTTYNEDSIMIANIDVLLERLQANCEELHLYIENQKNDQLDNQKSNESIDQAGPILKKPI